MAENQSFPDQFYINHLREALWSRQTKGYAAVMVGAGFSLNAVPARGGTHSFPTWTDLVSKLIDDLYPEGDEALREHREAARAAKSAASAMTRLAEEHAVAFGRASLDQRLLQLVPNELFEPSPLHELLLGLPWSDVFSTNWDTLLERTRRRVPERNYRVVASPLDIPRSVSPRIVKLHGSFPHARPFIVSEEDYRTYPERFAPFVNMVRQTAMENVLCLVGFSGDDPNFLAWTGWVRDQLRDHQPYIYLVTLGGFSSARRQLLEKRGVRLIELNRLAGLDQVPEGRRHATALEWFLKNLKAGRPDAWPRDWPDPPRGGDGPKGPPELPTIPPGRGSGYVAEPGEPPRREPPDFTRRPEQTADWLEKAILAWRSNRLAYPNWVVAPAEVRARLWEKISLSIDDTLEIIGEASLLSRLLALRELLFRLDVCAVSLSELLMMRVKETLDAVAAHVKPVGAEANFLITAHHVGTALGTDGDDKDAKRSHVSSGDIGLSWLELVFALLRHAREQGDSAGFAASATLIEASRSAAPGIWSRLCYERCLLALGRPDHEGFEQALIAWGEEDGGDPYWHVRRAALLAETGRVAEAEDLVERALDEIKRSRRTDVDDVSALSREAWALVLVQGLRLNRSTQGNPKKRSNPIRPTSEWNRRWREIAHLVDHPRDDINNLRIRLDLAPSWPGFRTAKRRDFDDRTRRVVRFSSGSGWTTVKDALQALRIADDAGLPSQIGHVTVSRDLRLKAIGWLREYAPTVAGFAYLRVGRIEDKEQAGEPFSRVWIARLGDEQAQTLAEQSRQALDAAPLFYRAAVRAHDPRANYWRERIKFALEVLSRVVLRLSVEEIHHVIERAIKYYKDPLFKSIDLQRNFTHLFDRAFEALPPADRLDHIVASLTLPFDEQESLLIARPLVMDAFQPVTPPPARDRFEPNLSREVEKLFDAVAAQDEHQHEALWRLIKLHELSLLKEDEAKNLIEELGQFLRGVSLPRNEPFRDDVLLILPQPEDRPAERAFRQAYLSPAGPDPFEVADAFRDSREFRILRLRLLAIGNAALWKKDDQPAIVIGVSEAALLARRLITCARRAAEVERDPFGWFDRDGLLDLVVHAFANAAIPNIDIDDKKLAESVRECLDLLEEIGVSTLKARIALLKLLPDQAASVWAKLERQLRSHRPARVVDGLITFKFFLKLNSVRRTSEPPGTMWTAVALLVADGWPPPLKQALEAATALIKAGNADLKPDFLDALLEGLTALTVEAAYTRPDRDDEPGIPADDVPAVRAAAVGLAAALADAGHEHEAAVKEWLELAKDDPLPEVRQAHQRRMRGAG